MSSLYFRATCSKERIFISNTLPTNFDMFLVFGVTIISPIGVVAFFPKNTFLETASSDAPDLQIKLNDVSETICTLKSRFDSYMRESDSIKLTLKGALEIGKNSLSIILPLAKICLFNSSLLTTPLINSLDIRTNISSSTSLLALFENCPISSNMASAGLEPSLSMSIIFPLAPYSDGVYLKYKNTESTKIIILRRNHIQCFEKALISFFKSKLTCDELKEFRLFMFEFIR